MILGFQGEKLLSVIFLWKPKFSLTPLFVQKQCGWITQGHLMRPGTEFQEDLNPEHLPWARRFDL